MLYTRGIDFFMHFNGQAAKNKTKQNKTKQQQQQQQQQQQNKTTTKKMKLFIVFLVSPHAVSTCKRMYSLSMSTCSLVPTLHGRREMRPGYEARASVTDKKWYMITSS